MNMFGSCLLLAFYISKRHYHKYAFFCNFALFKNNLKNCSCVLCADVACRAGVKINTYLSHILSMVTCIITTSLSKLCLFGGISVLLGGPVCWHKMASNSSALYDVSIFSLSRGHLENQYGILPNGCAYIMHATHDFT